MKILVTGGAGYIGSHVVKQLIESGLNDIIVVDNLSTGHKQTIVTLQKLHMFRFIELDLKDFNLVEELLQNESIDVIIHFAAFSQVSESISNPMKYYLNNTVNTTNLIKCASKYGVKKFIFSSTAAVYGEPQFKNGMSKLIDETFETKPINPYGMSKLMSETVLVDEAKVNKNFKYVILRYFNVAGADLSNTGSPIIGELHQPETHLIPLVVKTAVGKRDSITVFGEDYDTNDGTCIRDYIHVGDLARIHIDSVFYIEEHDSDVFNCGYGHGYSVKEIINSVLNVSNVRFEVEIGKRREGDPSRLVANNEKIKNKMKWKAQYDNIDIICKSALDWEKTFT